MLKLMAFAPLSILSIFYLSSSSSSSADGNVSVSDAPGPGHDGRSRRWKYGGPDGQPGPVPAPDPVPSWTCRGGEWSHERQRGARHGSSAGAGASHAGETWRWSRVAQCPSCPPYRACLLCLLLDGAPVVQGQVWAEWTAGAANETFLTKQPLNLLVPTDSPAKRSHRLASHPGGSRCDIVHLQINFNSFCQSPQCIKAAFRLQGNLIPIRFSLKSNLQGRLSTPFLECALLVCAMCSYNLNESLNGATVSFYILICQWRFSWV